MTKREKLEMLDKILMDKMTQALQDEDYDALKSMGTVATYLKNNQVITPPAEKSTAHDKIKEAIE